MDNKTASEWLESVKKYIHGGDEEFDRRRLEAIDAGIQALKVQEPQSPRFEVAYDKIFYACDNCGKSLVVMANSEGLVLQKDLPKYCNECGQAVKWPEPPKEET